ncbi:MAG: hypothetical protein JHC95_02810 [Solirubrobacteraceae bacterium]|nr:hypothetical protein [Solirubrobacteraceae bacterium]
MNRILGICALAMLIAPVTANAMTDHSSWPHINGLVLMNQEDGERPLDARPGNDPHGGQDRSYSWNQVAKAICKGGGKKCYERDGKVNGKPRYVVPNRARHNKLLGGHGSDTINAGKWGDVIWGDYKPGGQPTGQFDRLSGGAGNDHIYASWGENVIAAGGGDDYIKAFKGRGRVDCGPGKDVFNVSRRAKPKYEITGCETISHSTIGR